MTTPPRILLSPPHMGDDERRLLLDAFDSNWIAPLGPHVDAFERELAEIVGVPHVAALSSGTAALHLALRLVGVEPGDEVVIPTLTFVASATPVTYQGATPVFVDVDPATWTLDPNLLEDALERKTRSGRPPAAVMPVDLYGQCADYEALEAICGRFGVPLVEDAAEALGASYGSPEGVRAAGSFGRAAGSFGRAGVVSFNGNKILTTSGGGALASHDGELVDQARFLATQAREPAPHYQHSTLGYNYRLSNLLAAVGRGQLRVLDERVAARRANFEHYARGLGDLPGLSFMPEAPYNRATRWLTVVQIDPDEFGATREDVRLALEADNVEARPVWKPLHLQPVFEGTETVGGAVAEGLFEHGLCLPSGSALTGEDRERICRIVRRTARP